MLVSQIYIYFEFHVYVLISWLQALKALAHNYPNVISMCWEQVSSVTYVSFNSFLDAHPTSWRGNSEHTITSMRERAMTATIKVKYLST